MFTISLSTRDGANALLPPPLTWTVERLTWRAVGGPWTARLRAGAPQLNTLWQLADCLRGGLTVFDGRGAAWWGYLAAVELHAQGQVLRLALDDMANLVAVRYHQRTPNPWSGAPQQTAWASDAGAMALYGVKQRIFDLGPGGSLDAAAAAYATTRLGQVARPQASARVETGERAAEPYAIIEGRGWWETLDWTFASDPRGLEGHQSGGSVAVGVGNLPSAAKAAQSFLIASNEGWSADEIWIKLRRNQASDALLLEVRDGDLSGPGTDVLASANLPAAQISEELAWTRFALDRPATLQPGTLYWLVLSRSGALNSTAYAQFTADESAGYPRGELCLWDGSAWTARVPAADMHFQALGGEETSAQIAHLLGGAQFFRAARVEVDSGVSTRMYRDGSQRARSVVETLLQGGTAAGARLLAGVLADRTARVYAQPPASQAALALGPTGQIQRLDGRALLPCEWPAGQWARLGALTPAGGAPGMLFIESCAWEKRGGFNLSQT